MKIRIRLWAVLLLLVAGVALLFWLDVLAPGPARQALATATCAKLPDCSAGRFAYPRWPPRLEVTIDGGRVKPERIKRAYRAAIAAADAEVAFFAPDPAHIYYRSY
jgi:hypothetical protein